MLAEEDIYPEKIYGKGTDTQTNKQTRRHFNIMTRTGLRAGPSENRKTVIRYFTFFTVK